MARLTRVESQARTREHVLDTAYDLFLRDGFAITSMDRVAEVAGYSKGAVYSNFATKNDLCLAVLDRIHLEQAARLLAEVGHATDLDARLAGFERWAEATIGDSAWTALEVEFATGSRHDARVRGRLAARRRAITDTLRQVLDDQAEALGLELTQPAETAALTLLGLGIGIGVQRAIDPAVPVRPLVDLLRAILGTPVLGAPALGTPALGTPVRGANARTNTRSR